MIKNERQYRVTKAQARKFEDALARLSAAAPDERIHPRIRQAQLDAVRSQLEQLRSELAEYEALRSGVSPNLEWRDVSALGNLLIKARIRDLPSLVRACLFTLIPFMAFGSFFSQQWIVWMAPLLVLVAGPAELIALAVLDATLYLQFPVLYDIDVHSWHYDLMTVVRTAILLYIWYRTARAIPWKATPPLPRQARMRSAA